MGGRHITRKERLKAVADRLEPKPARAPYFLHAGKLTTEEPAPGWYIMWADSEVPTYLAFSATSAEVALLRRLDRQEATA